VLAEKSPAWRRACEAAPETRDNISARAYFEAQFTPYATSSNEGAEGLFTGYYVPDLQGSLTQEGMFQTPLYSRPRDMISVDLGAFKADLKGQHIIGKVTGTKLVPYDDRAEITRGSLQNRAEPLVWISDPVEAFFLEVQGSGHIHLSDDSQIAVGYDGANGRAYVAIGRAMADRGDLSRPVTMPAIRAWLNAHPEQAQQIMNINPSYVFFRRLPTEEVVGAEGVALTAQRSLAVDPKYMTLGAPVWLVTSDGRGAPFQRLMVAQRHLLGVR
jgi:membrane-bound lytic murein transglycosylase A